MIKMEASLTDLEKRVASLREHGIRVRSRTTPANLARRKMVCRDCDCFAEPYMVEDEVWLQAHPEGKHGFLCLHCLVARLGRPLKVSDFTNSLVNLPVFVGMETVLRALERGSSV